MPRRVRRCSLCFQQFVTTHATATYCGGALLHCRRAQSTTEPNLSRKRPRTPSSNSIDTTSELNCEDNHHSQAIVGPSPHSLGVDDAFRRADENEEGDNDDCSDNVMVAISDGENEREGSEGGDDFHCTQLQDAGRFDDNENEDEPLSSLLEKENDCIAEKQLSWTENAMTDGNGYCFCPIEPISNVSENFPGNSDPNLMKCFVCGTELTHIRTGFMGRLNHVKRCAKRHGVQAKDMHQVDMVAESHRITEASTKLSPHEQLNENQTSHTFHRHLPVDTGNFHETSVPLQIPSAFDILMAGARRVASRNRNDTKHMPPVSVEKGGRFRHGHSRKKDYSQRGCPFFKKIPGTDFVCDGFHYAKKSLTTNYFLTHFHADHYGGITKEWNAGTIYCSIPTANLVNQQLGVDRKYLHPLPMHTPVVIATLQGKPVTVILFDANHCPGAVMIYFSVGTRRILHVGDFRWNRSKMMNQPLAGVTFGSAKHRIDELFLDTTYCDAKYVLPTQDEAIEAAIEIIVKESHQAIAKRQRLLMLFGAYTIGKERLYLAAAERLGQKVYVDRRRYRILKALDLPSHHLSLLTTCPDDSLLWVVPLGHINMKKLPSYLSIRLGKSTCHFDRVIGFRPTGWCMTGGRNLVKTVNKGNLAIHSVPYSEHSSFPELVDCISCLQPKRIIPTVSVSKSERQVDLLLSHVKHS